MGYIKDKEGPFTYKVDVGEMVEIARWRVLAEHIRDENLMIDRGVCISKLVEFKFYKISQKVKLFLSFLILLLFLL